MQLLNLAWEGLHCPRLWMALRVSRSAWTAVTCRKSKVNAEQSRLDSSRLPMAVPHSLLLSPPATRPRIHTGAQELYGERGWSPDGGSVLEMKLDLRLSPVGHGFAFPDKVGRLEYSVGGGVPLERWAGNRTGRLLGYKCPLTATRNHPPLPKITWP